MLAPTYSQNWWLSSNEHLDKKVNVSEKLENNIYLTDDTGDAAIDILNHHVNTHGTEKPFFLYLTPNAIHFPVQGKPADRDQLIDELVVSKMEKPAQLDGFTVADIAEIIETLSMTQILIGMDPATPGSMLNLGTKEPCKKLCEIVEDSLTFFCKKYCPEQPEKQVGWFDMDDPLVSNYVNAIGRAMVISQVHST